MLGSYCPLGARRPPFALEPEEMVIPSVAFVSMDDPLAIRTVAVWRQMLRRAANLRSGFEVL